MANKEPVEGRCNANIHGDEYCAQHPVATDPPGHGKRCRFHGGATKRTRAKAQRRAAAFEAHRAAERLLAGAGVEADPIEHLLESMYRAAALVEVWGRMVADLDYATEVENPGALRGELRYEVDDDGLTVRVRDKLLALSPAGYAKVHPYVEEYQTAIERRARLAKLCVDAGVEERRVRIAEEQGQLLAEVIRAILTDLGHDVAAPEVRTTVRRHLLLVQGDAS